MATQNVEPDNNWGLLADEEEEERRTKMLRRYTELTTLSEEERMSQMMGMAVAEYELSEANLLSFTLSRLSVWLSVEPEMARQLSASYDAVMLKIPGRHAMRRVSSVQTLAKEFSLEQQTQLIDLLPDVFGGLEDAILARSRLQNLATTPTAPAAQVKKSWWPFGKR